jgi:DNA invertase Pin-like site-specific DNA recombinase
MATNNVRARAVTFLRARVNPHGEALRTQLNAQRRHCHEVADKLGVEITGEYVAIGGTGEAPVQQQIRAMLNDMRGARIEYVVVKSLDRLGRNTAEVARLLEAISETGATLVSGRGEEVREPGHLVTMAINHLSTQRRAATPSHRAVQRTGA